MEWNLALTAILAILQEAGPAIKTASVVANIITTLEWMIPIAIKYAKDQVAVIKNVILDVKERSQSSGAASTQQLDRLDALLVACNAAYDEATADANIADAADEAAKR